MVGRGVGEEQERGGEGWTWFARTGEGWALALPPSLPPSLSPSLPPSLPPSHLPPSLPPSSSRPVVPSHFSSLSFLHSPSPSIPLSLLIKIFLIDHPSPLCRAQEISLPTRRRQPEPGPLRLLSLAVAREGGRIQGLDTKYSEGGWEAITLLHTHEQTLFCCLDCWGAGGPPARRAWRSISWLAGTVQNRTRVFNAHTLMAQKLKGNFM